MQMQKRLVVKMLRRLPCPGCGRRPRRSDVHVLGQDNGLWLIGVHCPFCDHTRLASLAIRVRCPARELSRREREYFGHQPPINADDVLDMYRFLESFDGDLSVVIGSHPCGP